MEKQIEKARRRRDSRISIALTDSFSIDHMRILIHRINRDFDDEVNFIIKRLNKEKINWKFEAGYVSLPLRKKLKPTPYLH